MTDDRARRLRDLRNRTAGDRDGRTDEANADGTGDDESSTDDGTDATTDGESATEARDERADESTRTADEDDESAGDGDGSANGGGESVNDGSTGDGRTERGDGPDGIDPASSGEGEGESAASPGDDAVPAAGDGQQTVDPALQGAIADTSAMVSTTEMMGAEPTVDASAIERASDDQGRAAIGREGEVFEQGNTLLHSTQDRENTVQMLEFSLNDARYAIEIDRISAIVEMKDITRFPRGPEAIDGVTDLRGEITGVLDPTTMLDVERNELSDDQYIVVLKRDDDKQKLGIRVTDVSQAVTYRESQIDETGTVMDTNADHQHEFVRGIVKKNVDEQTTLVTWLDVDAIIENTE
ncbi:chemotaxis protein CheW [Natrarchaeobius oligotrophus]|uniref:Chemotaxis protein CheW n=1 Tax=Natrarchaeobius chitinivorans TaxID=1679083 RepID=A0A3N6MS73_NATCH|nr:chemotaxis protein CheW [Natrarchaeobius chitinivorans]RQG99141.1 chemotaxis protein CheW [Natrarchaeobius chitinivorans]